MVARVYLKQIKERGRMTIFVACSADILDGIRYFDGYQYNSVTEEWEEWDMEEKKINQLIKDGRMVRIQ